jgi:hypothetical protein
MYSYDYRNSKHNRQYELMKVIASTANILDVDAEAAASIKRVR